MFEKVELLYGVFRFTPFYLFLDFLLLAHLFISWRCSYRKCGWKIDYWFFILFVSFFMPIFLIYPFSASFFNFPVIGAKFFFNADGYIDKAFLITSTGYGSLWFGRFIFDKFKNRCFLDFPFRMLRPLCKSLEKSLSSNSVAYFLFFFCVALEFIVLLVAFRNQCFWNPRSYFLKTGSIRPLYNLTASIFAFAIGFITIRFLQYRNKTCKYLLLGLLLFSFFLGIRGVIIAGLVNFFLYLSIIQKGKINFLKLAIYGVLFFILAIYIDGIRNDNFSIMGPYQQFFFQLFYGNNFSDVRDFGIILGSWDEQFVLGKTYLAGLISFIPRALSSFRDGWSISIFTNSQVGLDSALHPGLRPGPFGEAYFNFGIPGVILVGIFVGYIIRYIDASFKKAIATDGYMLHAYSLTLVFLLTSCLFVSVGFWSFYSVVILIGLIFSVRKLASPKVSKFFYRF